VARVACFGLVVGIRFDPCGTAGGSIRDYAIEESRGHSMAPKGRGNDVAGNSDYGSGLGPANLDQSEETVVGTQRGVDPSDGLTVEVCEIPVSRSAPKPGADGGA